MDLPSLAMRALALEPVLALEREALFTAWQAWWGK
jgi:hypothetical protein